MGIERLCRLAATFLLYALRALAWIERTPISGKSYWLSSRGGAERYDWLWGGFGGSGAAPSSPTDCSVHQHIVSFSCLALLRVDHRVC